MKTATQPAARRRHAVLDRVEPKCVSAIHRSESRKVRRALEQLRSVGFAGLPVAARQSEVPFICG